MKINSMVTKAVAFIMAAAVGISAVGCGVENQQENTGTHPSITEAGVSDTQQNAAADINGTGRY
ncbi:MAG: hypothetical protein K2M91_05020, partial [Lachnospiraceae bacterium]|nr:hypothetical protein [Lachnospiraceae bacterium]